MSDWKTRLREQQLEQIEQIAQLAHNDRVDSDDPMYPWMITGRRGGGTKHDLGHCICDGALTVEDIRPHWEDLMTVVRKFQDAGNIDSRFRACAEFILDGNLEKLAWVEDAY
jgi:hypothetical protein